MTSKDNRPKGDLLDQAMRQSYQECNPLFTTIEITLDCNLKCKHCYNYDREEQNVPNGQAMSREEILETIAAVAAEGALFICLTGGEALLHPHLEDFIQEIIKQHSVARLKSNGLLLNEKKIERLARLGVDLIDISLYGASEESYRNFTGSGSAFTRVMNAIDACIAQKMNISLSIILNRSNIHELDAMVNMAREKGVSFQFSDEITSRYDGDTAPQQLALSEADYEQLLKGPFSEYFNHYNDDNTFQCNCARSVCGISAFGEVYPCIGAPLKSGNLRNQSFAQIWKESKVLNDIRNIQKEDFKECNKCDFKNYCNRSSGGIYINTGEYKGCDEDSLMKARVRSKVAAEDS